MNPGDIILYYTRLYKYFLKLNCVKSLFLDFKYIKRMSSSNK